MVCDQNEVPSVEELMELLEFQNHSRILLVNLTVPMLHISRSLTAIEIVVKKYSTNSNF